MTRAEKVRKLANAVREYRGATAGRKDDVPIWSYTPKPSAVDRVKAWLSRLHLDVQETLKLVDGFKTYNEFDAWLKTL